MDKPVWTWKADRGSVWFNESTTIFCARQLVGVMADDLETWCSASESEEGEDGPTQQRRLLMGGCQTRKGPEAESATS